MKFILKALLLSILLYSCSQENSKKQYFEAEGSIDFDREIVPSRYDSPANESQINSNDNTSNKNIDKKKLIKDGVLRIKVNNISDAKTQIDKLLTKWNGYYENESLSNNDLEATYQLKIRIPSNNFDNFASQIENENSTVLSKEYNTRDVTDQFIDFETRLINKRSYLERYKEILKQCKNVNDILEVEEKIRYIEEEIDVQTGKLKYLTDQVEYSTLRLYLIKPNNLKSKLIEEENFFTQLINSIIKGWYFLIDLILFVFIVWPLGLLIFISFFLWKKYKKRKTTKS